MTKTERTCSRCGLVFASEKLDGLCPSCLLNSLFEDEDPGDTQAFWEEEPQTPFTPGTSDKPGSPPLRRFSHFEILEELGPRTCFPCTKSANTKASRFSA